MPIVVPQSNPKAGYLAHQAAIDQAIARVLGSGWYILGEEVAAFEREFAAYLGIEHAIGVASGTDALLLALRACGIGSGDVVYTVSHTAVATVTAIELCGATATFVDIDPATCIMDPEDLACALGEADLRRAKAIIPVHLYGQPADLTAITGLASRYGLWVIEDCAQSHGALYRGRRAGTWGDLAAFSFYPTKNLGALGDGGMVVTGDAALAERLRMLREYGWRQRYVSDSAGLNSRLDELQAAILRAKLPHLDAENEVRRLLAARYTTLLNGTSLRLPYARPDVQHVYHQYAVRTSERDALRTYLQERGIATSIHYPVPVHQQPAYMHLDLPARPLPHTEAAAAEVLSLPLYPQLVLDQVHMVAEAIQAWEGERR